MRNSVSANFKKSFNPFRGVPETGGFTLAPRLAPKEPRGTGCMRFFGWITAAGFDSAEVVRSYCDRVYDMHLKDKVVERLVHFNS